MEDNRKFEIRSRFKGSLSYRSKSGKRFVWNGTDTTLTLTFAEVVELMNSSGGRNTVENKLILPEELTKEFNLELEPEYYFTFDQLKVMVEKADIEILEEALEYNNKGVREAIRDAALDVEVADSNKRKLIEREFNLDFDNFVDWKQDVVVSPKKSRGERKVFKFED